MNEREMRDTFMARAQRSFRPVLGKNGKPRMIKPNVKNRHHAQPNLASHSLKGE